MRRVFSMILALCMIVGLLPAVAVIDADAAVTTRTIQSMVGTDYVMTLTATNDGATVSYTKNQEITLEETDEEGNPLTEWVQVPGDENNWNAKYYYNAETERFTLEMKGVKVTKSCTYAFGVSDKSVSTQGGAMEFVITEDSYFENCRAISSVVGGSYRFSHTYVTSQNGATLYVDNTAKPGASGIWVMRDLTVNANLDIKTMSADSIGAQAANDLGTVTINGGNIKIIANHTTASGTWNAISAAYDVVFNGGTVTLDSTHMAIETTNGAITVAEGLCYTVKNLAGDADAALTGGDFVFTAYGDHTAGAWAEGKTNCTACGAELICEHEFAEQITQAPTCTAEGVLTKACTICGVAETEAIEKLPHSYVAVDGEVADGAFTRTHTCSVCGDIYTETVTVMSGTVTLFGTAVTIDTDSTTADIPEAYYWVDGAEGAAPTTEGASADNWNYSFTIKNNVLTVSLKDANYSYAARCIAVAAAQKGTLNIEYYGTNNIKVSTTASTEFLNLASKSAEVVNLIGAEDAVLNVTGGAQKTALITVNSGTTQYRELNMIGGTINLTKGSVSNQHHTGALSAAYCAVLVENCDLNVTVSNANTNAAYATYATVYAGGGTVGQNFVIRNSNVTVTSSQMTGIAVATRDSSKTGYVLYRADMIIEGDSSVVVNHTPKKTSSYDLTTKDTASAIVANKIIMKGGSLEASESNANKDVLNATLDLSQYDSCLDLYIEKDGDPVLAADYANTKYIKIVPAAEHGETVEGIDDVYFVTECVKCGNALSREEAPKLDTAYTLKIDGTEYTLTHKDIPVYTVNTPKTGYFNVTETKEVTNEETGEVTTEEVTTLTAMDYISQASAGADESNYNAKLIWHSGDEAPTLYLRDFILDCYNEELGQWRRNSGGTTQTPAGIHTGSTAPLTIQVESGDCFMRAHAGLQYQNALTIQGADDASLSIWAWAIGIAPSSVGSQYVANGLLSGNKLTLDANLMVSTQTWSATEHSPAIIRVIGADLVINGGNIITEYNGTARSIKGILIENSGNLYINDGYVYSASYNGNNLKEAAIEVADNIYISGGSVEAFSAEQSGMKASNIYISGGEVKITAEHSGLIVREETGVIGITGGAIEFTSRTKSLCAYGTDSQTAKLPAVTVPEGFVLNMAAGETAETAIELTQEQVPLYAYADKYVKMEYAEVCLHVEEILPAKDATCTETGLTEGKKCSVCGEILVAQEELPMLEHSWVTVEGKEATCTETGLTAGEKCDVCGEWGVEQEELETIDHDWVTIEGKAATCTETGLTAGEACSVCGEISIEQEVLEMIDHDWVTVEGKAATCTETGLTDGEACDVCGAVKTAQEEIPALGHTPKDAVKENETETSYDSVVYCAVCNTELSRETIETGCKHAETAATEEVLVAATCETAGSKKVTVTCVACGEVISETTEEIAALGHAFTNYVSDGNGYKTASCDNGCGATDTKVDETSDILANVTVAENGQVNLKLRNPALLKEVFMYYIADNAYEGQTGLVTWKTSMHKQLLAVTKAVNDADVNGADGYRTYGMTDLPQLTKTGTYVFRVRYYENNVERMLVQVIDVENINSEATVPAAESVTDIDVSAGGKILFTIDSPATLTKLYIYYIGDNECPIPTGEISWKSSYHTTLTQYTLAAENAAVNGSEGYRAYAIDNMPKLTRNGNYIFRIRYVLGGTTYYNVKEVKVENLEYSFDMDYAVDGRVILTGDNEYVSRVDIYYIGNNECPIPTGDISWKSSYFTALTNYSKAEENIGVNGTAGYIAYDRTKLPRLNTLGTYVLRVRYTDPNGVAKDRVYTKTFTEVAAPLTYDVAFDANGQMSLVGDTTRVRKIVAYYVGTNGYAGETGEMAYFTSALQKELLALGKANPAAFGAGGYRSFAPSNMPVLTVDGDYVFRVIYRDVDGVEKSYIVHETLG